MPDINLLDDTKTPEGGGAKPRTPAPAVPFTTPARQPSAAPEPRLRSSFWSRVSSWFAPKGPRTGGSDKKKEQPLKPIIKAVAPDSRVYREPDMKAVTPPAARPTPAVPVSPMTPAAAGPVRRQFDRQKSAAPDAEKIEGDSFMVNLLPDDLAGKVNPRKKLLLLGAVVGGSAIVIAVVALALSLYKSNIVRRTEDVRTQRAAVEFAIRSSRDEHKQSLALADRAETVQALLNRHIYWTKFFSLLERYTDPNVAYNAAFAGDIKGSLSMRAVASDYRAMSRQMTILNQASDFVSKAVSTSATSSTATGTGGQQVNFSIEMTLVPNIFTETAQEFQSLHPTLTATAPAQ